MKNIHPWLVMIHWYKTITFLNCLCSTDEELLKHIYSAVSVYSNFTGKAKCLDLEVNLLEREGFKLKESMREGEGIMGPDEKWSSVSEKVKARDGIG